MNTSIIYILIAVFVVLSLVSVITMLFSKKKNNVKRREANDRNRELYNSSNIAKIIIWINLESINGTPLDESKICYSKIKSNMTGLSEIVDILLIEPGEYNFIVNSREYNDVKINALVEAGIVYQLGADEDGPYFIPDPQPNRYQLAQF